VDVTNPNGLTPFVAATDFAGFFSSCNDARLHDPYKSVKHSVNYGNWLVSMQNRAWRKSISTDGTSVREIYAADGASDDNFTLPSVTFVFGLTIPENTFTTASVNAVPCVFKIRTGYCFS
jgi:hypothetical protein